MGSVQSLCPNKLQNKEFYLCSQHSSIGYLGPHPPSLGFTSVLGYLRRGYPYECIRWDEAKCWGPPFSPLPHSCTRQGAGAVESLCQMLAIQSISSHSLGTPRVGNHAHCSEGLAALQTIPFLGTLKRPCIPNS